jgi:hypothetical protein
MNAVIVSRHPAAIEFIRDAVALPTDTPVIESATADDVRGRVVYGNLPLHLAAHAAQVVAVEFSGAPPRGQEYDVAAMRAAGARLARYAVASVASPQAEIVFDDGRKPRGHRNFLFVGRGDTVHQFLGGTLPGVAAIARREDEQAGKWSHSVYTIRFAPGAWHLLSVQDWESGERFHGCASVAEIVAQFRAAGCTAPAAAIESCLERACPKTMERIRQTEADLASVR